MLGRVANTIASRDLGLVVGLLALTPLFVHQINNVQSKAEPPLLTATLAAGMPIHVDLQLAAGLVKAADAAPQSELPDIKPAFATVAAANPSSAPQLRSLEPKAEAIIRSVATKAFHSSLLGAAGFALLALLVVVVPLPGRPRRRHGTSQRLSGSDQLGQLTPGAPQLVERRRLEDVLEVEHPRAHRVERTDAADRVAGDAALAGTGRDLRHELADEALLIEPALAGDHGPRGAHPPVELDGVEHERGAADQLGAERRPETAGKAARGAGHLDPARIPRHPLGPGGATAP